MEQPLVAEHRGGTNRVTTAAATAAHTRYLSSPAAATLPTEKCKVSCSGFLPKTKPMQHSCIITTSLRHHFPKSPLPFITTSLRHIPTSLRHHFPSSPLPFVTTSHRHHFPSSPLPFVTTQRHSFLFFCYVLFCYVLLCGLPPFIKVNCIASYSFVMYCYVMYCYVIYHPSSKSIP